MSAEADSVRYTSSLPLYFLNSTEPVIIRENLCGEYSAAIRNGNRVTLRWMQRYTSSPNATWYLDDIKIRVWDGACFRVLLRQDFEGLSSEGELSTNVYRNAQGSIAQRDCGNGASSELYFHGFDSADIQRRSLVVVIPSHINESACEDLTTYTCELSLYCGCHGNI